ncbi:MAG: hypothetical protein HYZ13_03035 [Acidobacteria bacterium]|nr:hypothetical protein [Acidobacteriota bacterium]
MASAIVMLAAALCSPGFSQDLASFKSFLASHALQDARSAPIAYKVDYRAYSDGKPKGRFQHSGTLVIGLGLDGVTYVGTPWAPKSLDLGEPAPSSEGEAWFRRFSDPARMAPWADPAAVLGALADMGPAKAIEPPQEEAATEGPRILIFSMEAPRPNANFWTFQVKAGEARLHIQKDGTPLRLDVIQGYRGRLSPHFGRYGLDRRETWTFNMDKGRLRTTSYHLVLHRQDWKHSFQVEVEMTAGGSQ